MNSEKTDLELAVLIAISSDRDLLNKAVDEGFRPELLRSSPGCIAPPGIPHVPGSRPRESVVATCIRALPCPARAALTTPLRRPRLLGAEMPDSCDSNRTREPRFAHLFRQLPVHAEVDVKRRNFNVLVRPVLWIVRHRD